MERKMFIPTKLKVGFQERSDTFTGKLSYVTYYDEKNRLRKETSWKGWCKENLGELELDNTPRTGYIFNKGVQRSSEWFGSGRSMFRIYDPRDFEFEITVDNTIQVLMHSDISKREILEPCVLAWYGTELVLLPTNSKEYQASVAYTEKQTGKVSAKSLVKGYQYNAKKDDSLYTYIGYYEWWDLDHLYYNARRRVTIPGVNPEDSGYYQVNKGKKHIFYNNGCFCVPSVSTLSACAIEEVHPQYAELVDKLFRSEHCSQIMSAKNVDVTYDEVRQLCQNEDYNFQMYPTFYKVRDDGITIEELRIDLDLILDRYNGRQDIGRCKQYLYDIKINPSKATFFGHRYCTVPGRYHYYPNSREAVVSDVTETFKSSLLENVGRLPGKYVDTYRKYRTDTNENTYLEERVEHYWKLVDFMNKMGYSTTMFILENGQEVKHKLK